MFRLKNSSSQSIALLTMNYIGCEMGHFVDEVEDNIIQRTSLICRRQ